MKLHLGCGNRRIDGFVNIDVMESDAVDLTSDVMKLPYEENSVDLIYGCSMLEHFGRNNRMNFFRKTCWTDFVIFFHLALKSKL